MSQISNNSLDSVIKIAFFHNHPELNTSYWVTQLATWLCLVDNMASKHMSERKHNEIFHWMREYLDYYITYLQEFYMDNKNDEKLQYKGFVTDFYPYYKNIDEVAKVLQTLCKTLHDGAIPYVYDEKEHKFSEYVEIVKTTFNRYLEGCL